MVEQYLRETWAYLRNNGTIDVDFERWVNTLSNLSLIEYIDAAAALKETGDE